MNGTEVLEFARDSIVVLLKISAPLLLTALVVGLIIALFQTLTQLQEATLTFVPKILVVFVLLLALFPYFADVLELYFHDIANTIIGFGAA